MNETALKWLLLFSCGGLGTLARYAVSEATVALWGYTFPFGTLIVNCVGSFSIGLVMYLFLNAGVFSPLARMALTTGLLGGFTTYSSFNFEVLSFLTEERYGKAALYLGGTVVLCLGAGFLGLALGRSITQAVGS